MPYSWMGNLVASDELNASPASPGQSDATYSHWMNPWLYSSSSYSPCHLEVGGSLGRRSIYPWWLVIVRRMQVVDEQVVRPAAKLVLVEAHVGGQRAVVILVWISTKEVDDVFGEGHRRKIM